MKLGLLLFPVPRGSAQLARMVEGLGFDSLVREVSQDRPFLGICVGMQALLDHSEENDGVDCIGLFPGNVKFFGKDLHEDGEHLKVPYIGWNEVAESIDDRSVIINDEGDLAHPSDLGAFSYPTTRSRVDCPKPHRGSPNR
jgi:imidazoleglycerol phosphate synthase glutamine amidotransferase subunit HisH